jgi:hypothetical protein
MLQKQKFHKLIPAMVLLLFMNQIAAKTKGLLNKTINTADTIQIDASKVNPSVLKEGTHRYLVYFKMGKDSNRIMTQFWTRAIKRVDYNGVPAFEISQEWEDKDSIMHIVKSISDAKTMQPLYHKTWWKVQASRNSTVKTVNETIVDFTNKTVNYNNHLLSDADTAKQAKAIWQAYKSSINQYALNWHLDLETFPILPYKTGVTFMVPFYDPGTGSPHQKVAYTVVGSDQLTGFDNQKIDCWLLKHETKGNIETFWISKKTKEVLKLEQEMNGRLYRYKIKLGFSL